MCTRSIPGAFQPPPTGLMLTVLSQVFTSGTDEHLELCKAVKELVSDDLKMDCNGQAPQVGSMP